MGNSEIYLYPNSKIAKSALNSFNTEIGFYNEFYNGLISEIKSLNNDVFRLISDLPLDKLFISLTTSNSIFYRFTLLNSTYEFKLEVFFDYNENEESDIQSTLHIYHNGVKEKAVYGSLEYLYNIITETYGKFEYSYTPLEIYTILPQETKIKEYEAIGLSPVFSS